MRRGGNVLYTLEKGTYVTIMEKLGTQPINGGILINLGNGQKSDFKAVGVEYVDNKLSVYVFSVLDSVLWTYVINPDNTVTQVE